MPNREQQDMPVNNKRIKKIAIWTSAVLLGLLIVASISLSWYIKTNKDRLLKTITQELNDQFLGEVSIENMAPALFKSFPEVSLRLVNVKVQDSLYSIHKKNALELTSVYIKLNLPSLFTSQPKIKKVTLSQGQFYLFKQKDGYSNAYVFSSRNKKKKKQKNLDITHFALNSITCTYDNFLRNKQFKVTFKEADGSAINEGDDLNINVALDALVHQLGFNLDKGGYLVKQPLKGNLHMRFQKDVGRLVIPEQPLSVGGIPIDLKAVFNFAETPIVFDLDLNAKSINFTKGIHMLPQSISKKLDSFSIKENIAAHALIKGSFAYPDTPYVNIYFDVKNNTINTPMGVITNVTCRPEFNNHIYPGKGRSDNNTAVTARKIVGNWEGIPFETDTMAVFNLLEPRLTTRIHSSFEVEKLNNLLGNSFEFTRGKAVVHLFYEGPVTADNIRDYHTDGSIRIKDASMTYVPRHLQFQRCNGLIRFDKKDLSLEDVTLSSEKSTVKINGVTSNFLNTFFNDPSKAVFNWKIESQSIDLDEFKTLLNPRYTSSAKKPSPSAKISKLSHRLDDILDKSTMYLDLKVAQVNYRQFEAKKIFGKLALREVGINLDNISLSHAGGTINASGTVNQSRIKNPFKINAKIEKVKVDRLFYAFENFGQETILDTNIKGSFSADVAIKGELREDDVSLIKNSVAGSVKFTLRNGELNDFPPLLAVSKFVFKNRNLDHITFETLSNDLTVKNGKIKIPAMEINSSALRMEVEGIYALDRGTDISLAIPLRNPEKDKRRVEKGLEPKPNKGIIVYLRAKDDKEGKVRLEWDPLRK